MEPLSASLRAWRWVAAAPGRHPPRTASLAKKLIPVGKSLGLVIDKPILDIAVDQQGRGAGDPDGGERPHHHAHSQGQGSGPGKIVPRRSQVGHRPPPGDAAKTREMSTGDDPLFLSV